MNRDEREKKAFLDIFQNSILGGTRNRTRTQPSYSDMSAIFSSQNTAVITGGASGIGLALAKKCVGHGMRVLVADWDEGNLEAAGSVLGDGASTIKMDVSKMEDWTALREKVVEDFGGLFERLVSA